ncbi:unnamed protein product [Candidula unifasciata]|uniref:C2H2-type domain-containing protein n=1 Tax=Candidula unifasciata TaxID=100452 RepID=A0A8S3ZQ43_9EUPU|nr:unnamed protein product [Candidula unifasciata]
MDYDSSSKFISSLAKFLQSLCNGYVEFDSGVHVIGHLYLSVDTGKTIDYILNEKVCKTDENSVTFISNSFHAQPAEKPKPPAKRSVKDSEKADLKAEDSSENYVGTQGEPRSTNVGTLPSARIANQNSPHSHGAKRPYSPSHTSQSKTGRVSPRHKKNRTDSLDPNTSHLANPSVESNVSSVPSPATDAGLSNTSARNSDVPHGSQMNAPYEQNYFQQDDENSLSEEPEERDIKPSIDTDVTFIKEEYGSSSSCSQSGSQGRDRTHGDETSAYPYQSNQVFPGGYPGQGSFGASHRANFNSSSSHMFSPGQSVSKFDESSGDPSDYLQNGMLFTKQDMLDVGTRSASWSHTCSFCDKKFQNKADCKGHINSVHLNAKPFVCEHCAVSYSYRQSLSRHLVSCKMNPYV